MKTDTQLQKDVMDEIKWEPSTTAAQIGVTTANGIVTLTVTVATYGEKWAVERAAQRVEEVKGPRRGNHDQPLRHPRQE